MAQPGIKELLEAGVHFGHQTRRWNPKMRRFLHGERDGIYIIDLLKTKRLLDQASEFAGTIAHRGGTVLFVGTKKQARDAVAEVAEATGMPYVNHRWLGGLLTNFQTMSERIRRLHDLERYEADGQLALLPTRERLAAEADLAKLRANLGGVKNMKGTPAAIFVIDLKTEAIAVREAQRLRIPIIGLVDTNCDPDGIDFVIPGNDDAIRSCAVIARAIGESVGEGAGVYRAEQERLRAEAEERARREAEERAKREAEQAEQAALAAAAAAEAEAAAAAARAAAAVSAPAAAEAMRPAAPGWGSRPSRAGPGTLPRHHQRRPPAPAQQPTVAAAAPNPSCGAGGQRGCRRRGAGSGACCCGACGRGAGHADCGCRRRGAGSGACCCGAGGRGAGRADCGYRCRGAGSGPAAAEPAVAGAPATPTAEAAVVEPAAGACARGAGRAYGRAAAAEPAVAVEAPSAEAAVTETGGAEPEPPLSEPAANAAVEQVATRHRPGSRPAGAPGDRSPPIPRVRRRRGGSRGGTGGRDRRGGPRCLRSPRRTSRRSVTARVPE